MWRCQTCIRFDNECIYWVFLLQSFNKLSQYFLVVFAFFYFYYSKLVLEEFGSLHGSENYERSSSICPPFYWALFISQATAISWSSERKEEHVWLGPKRYSNLVSGLCFTVELKCYKKLFFLLRFYERRHWWWRSWLLSMVSRSAIGWVEYRQ